MIMRLISFLKRIEKDYYVFVWRGNNMLHEGWNGELKNRVEDISEIKTIKFLDGKDIEIIVK